jgi:2-haloacid dehalogenase
VSAGPAPRADGRFDAVLFDLGGVLIDWDPRYLYRRLLPEREVDEFLTEIGFAEWNHAQDADLRPWADAVAALSARHPNRRDLIAAYPARFAETLGGPIHGTVELLRDLSGAGVPLFALTNWSAALFPVARQRFDFLDLFRGIVVSGEEGVAKPDPALFRVAFDRFGLQPETTVYVDDFAANVSAGASLGLHAIAFHDADRLRRDLAALGLP